MKLRLENNSLRLRVSKSDLAQLQMSGIIINEVNFINNKFQYVLCTYEDIQVDVIYREDVLRISLPKNLAKNWIDSDQVGIQATIPVSADCYLYVLVEKDFPCKTNTNEEKQNTFTELAQKVQVPKC